jgi:hypothetical protein
MSIDMLGCVTAIYLAEQSEAHAHIHTVGTLSITEPD